MDDDAGSTSGIAKLPENILEHILMHVNPYGDLEACRLVSRLWYRLARGALVRLDSLFRRCEAIEWYMLSPANGGGNLPATAPIAERCSHSACYHSQRSAMFVFGGCTAAYTTFNDLWCFDLTARLWQRLIPRGNLPTPKALATMLEYKGQLLLFGGFSKSSPNPIHQTAMFFNELHSYNPVQNAWTEIVTHDSAPHLAGHTASIVDDWMIIFGGSEGTGSSNTIWILDLITRRWHQPLIGSTAPTPRYGHSQIKLDGDHLLVVGGCGGPNMIFADVWMLEIARDLQVQWKWTEITVTNPELSAPQLWCHPSCRVGEKLVVLSKPVRSPSNGATLHNHRNMSIAKQRNNVQFAGRDVGQKSKASGNTTTTTAGLLQPQRRKLLTSRSLDDQDSTSNCEPTSSSSCNSLNSDSGEKPCSSGTTNSNSLVAGLSAASKKWTAALQRASSIPAIIVGEIPKLVVTPEPPMGAGEDGSMMDNGGRCIALAASSLLPSQASAAPAPSHPNAAVDSPFSRPMPPPPGSIHRLPRLPRGSRQQHMLNQIDNYVRNRAAAVAANAAAARSNARDKSSNAFPRYSSPPPSNSRQQEDRGWLECLLQSRNPMCVYVLDLGNVIAQRQASWSCLPIDLDAPEDTILYSVVVGRGELIMFGGMRSQTDGEGAGGLNVSPFSHSITNHTFILKPPQLPL